MRVYAVSDLHVDYPANARWVEQLSRQDYRDDLLILAGDVSHKRSRLEECLGAMCARFRDVLFVPGNHDLWVLGDERGKTSLRKFVEVADSVRQAGAHMAPIRRDGVLFVPLVGWYDYSFGGPSEELVRAWSDYRACRWPEGFGPPEVSRHLDRLNPVPAIGEDERVVTFSHFMPRLDLLPSFVSARHRLLDPVLGSTRLEARLRSLNSRLHVYGHSHINRSVMIDGVRYVNNAFGYPHETALSSRQLLQIQLP